MLSVANDESLEQKLKEAIKITKKSVQYLENIQGQNSLLFISPESTGRVNARVDYRSEFYSLGVVLYHLFTGRYPFSAHDHMQLVYAHIAITPASIASIDQSLPVMLSKLVDKLLSKNPDERYQSIEGILYDLEFILKNPDTTFYIASKDVINTMQVSRKLYGREYELRVIKQAINGIGKKIISIGGYSGMGKSALVESVKDKTTNLNIFFAEAKFEQQKNMQTFNAIFEALRDCVKMILFKKEEELLRFKTVLMDSIGENIQLMNELIPELKTIVNEEFVLGKLHPNEAQNRFNLTFLKFIKVISSFDEKIVLFIDDVQWSDATTIKMIDLIQQDSDIADLVIILSYRSNEIIASDTFSVLLTESKEKEEWISLELHSLELSDIELMLHDIFGENTVNHYQFAKLLKQKTAGNPFFIKELLYNLYYEKFVYFDVHEQEWHWDIQKIKQKDVSSNVVDIVSKKINDASFEIKEILKYAALIGSEFEVHDVATPLNQKDTDISQVLREHQHMHFVTQNSETHYEFVHDKVQEAFSHYLSEDEKCTFHLKVGEYLLNRGDDLFKTTDHLNKAKELIIEAEKRYELLELNHKCAKEAFKLNSYSNAIYYLLEAKSLQSDAHWAMDYQKSIELNTLLTEVYYLNLEFNRAKTCFEEVLDHARSLNDKVKIIQIEIFSRIAQNKMQEALDLGLEILNEFGIVIPESDDMIEYYPKLFQCYDVDKISELKDKPQMLDEEKLNILDILNSIMAPAYLVAPHVYPKICYVAMDQCVNYGNSAASTNVYAVHALLLSAFFNEFEQSYDFSKLAQSLIEQYDAQAYIAKVDMIANACVLHWNGDIKNTLQPLYHTVSAGIEVGDFEYACYSSMYCTLYSLLSGEGIPSLKQLFAEQTGLMNSLKQSYQALYSSVWQEFLENLTLSKENTLSLEGDFFSEKKSLARLEETNSFSILYNLYFSKSILALMYEDIEQAYIWITKAKAYHIGVASLYQFGEFYFYEAVISYRLYTTSGEINKEELLKLLEDTIAYYRTLSQSSAVNNEHKHQLIQALLLHVQEDSSCWKAFENASNTACLEGFTHIEAIIHQLAFYYWEDEGMQSFSQACFEKSYDAYQNWGAVSVANYLKKEHALVTKASSEKVLLNLDNIDLNSVLQASHTLAQELSPDELLKKMIKIIVENSASQNVFLFLQEDESLSMAIGYKNGTFIQSLDSVALPKDIINYVRRTQESIIYSANDKNDFIQNDTYILHNQPKSLFCTSIHYQGEFRGVLYLENRDIPDLYSEEEIELLQHLCNQAMISIEQAKLFEKVNQANTTLEDQVRFRTKELQEQKEIFEKLFYDSSDGALLYSNQGFIDCNSATLKMLEYESKHELINAKPSDISPRYQADGRESDEKAEEMIQLCTDKGSHRFEWIHQKTNEEIFWVDISLTKIKISGEEVIFAQMKDITEQKSVLHDLEYIASHDTMTGIYNRRKFFELAKKKFKKSPKLYAAMIDIDQFKNINDTYGHACGDEVIIKTAAIIKACLDEDEIFGRIGGEEYAIISDVNGFIKKIEKIKIEIEELTLRHKKKEINFTVSCGISYKKVETASLDMLLKEADDALYKAKENGRNRIERYRDQTRS